MTIDEFPHGKPAEGQTHAKKSAANWGWWAAASLVPMVLFVLFLLAIVSSGRVDRDKISRVTIVVEVDGVMLPANRNDG